MPEQPSTRTKEEAHLKVLRAIDAEPTLSQRDLAKQLGISLGKTNYCLQALLEKGWIKAKNFKNNKNKIAYSYLLTPKGIDQKAKLTLRFLDRKRTEYEALKHEIEQLRKEVSDGP
jgi:EPS-associated MarR family transcriptional regulator